MKKAGTTVFAVIALVVSLWSYVRGSYGITGPVLGKVSLFVAGLAAFFGIVNSNWFHNLTNYARRFTASFSIVALSVLGFTIDHFVTKFSPHPPHIVVQDCFFQNTTVGQDLQWQVFYRNDGGAGVVELVSDIEMSSRVPSPEHRAYIETFYFNMSQKKLDDLNGQKQTVDVAANTSYTANAHAPVPSTDWMPMAAAGGVVYLTGIFRYIGHPELPNAEFCYFWVQKTPDKSERCLLHNTP